MKQFILSIFVTASACVCLAQAPAKPAAPKPAARPATAGVKLPPGVPPARGILKTAFSLRYQDVRIGTGADAEPNKIYKVSYTGWLAADGHKFDSSYDHKIPVIGKDGKPELDADGKPKVNDGEPISFPQGFGRVIPGFDQGFTGMKIGGKRRLFIPWQLAYGSRGRPGPSAANPGIPAKADLIFDIELVDVSEMPAPQARPGMGTMPNGQPMRTMPHPGASGTPDTPAASPANPTPPPTAAPSNPATPPAGGTPPPTSAPKTPPPADTPTTPPPTDKPQSN
jgi:peptidylprolyl isomerase